MQSNFTFTAAWISSLVASILTLLVAFNVALTDAQQKAILGVVAISAPLIVYLASKIKGVPTE